MTQDIIEMAKQCGHWNGQTCEMNDVGLVAFANLVADKATEEANARANASWTLMCKKMVAIEREALAQHDSVQAKPEPEQEPVAWKLMPRDATDSMLKAMDECSTEGYDERLYAGHAASVYMAAWDEAPTPPQRKQEFIKYEVENADDWSEWVCPDPKGYLMKCCDCGLVHEAEFGVVRYKSETEREDCEPVEDSNLQAVFRMRRSEQWSPEDTAHRAGGLPMAQPEQEPVAWMDADGNVSDNNDHKCFPIPLYTTPPQRTWVELTDEEMTHTNHHMVEGAYQYSFKQGAKWAEAKLKERNA